jgi:hypothetical protein
MTNSPRLELPYLEAAQAQKHVTLNESLRLLDGIVQLAVVSATTTAPPGSPANGVAYIVPSGATGDWSGWAGSIALYADTAWLRIVPAEGWSAWVSDTDRRAVYSGSAWAESSEFFGIVDIPFLMPDVGDYILGSSGAGGSTLATLACVANTVMLFPFVPRASFAVDRLSVNVTSGVASAQGKLVVYASDANGRPDAKITETADLDFSSTGLKEATVALTLKRGVTYWLGLRNSSTATLSTFTGGGTPDINGGTPSTFARKVIRRTLTYATAAPSSWVYVNSEVGVGNSAAPAVWLRRA